MAKWLLYLNFKVSLVAVCGGVGICHGDEPSLQRRLNIIFSERHARFQAEFFHKFHRRHGVSFDDGHQRPDLIADMALMVVRIPCKFGDCLFDNAEHEQDKAI